MMFCRGHYGPASRTNGQLKLPSSRQCNNHSYEAILRHFFIALDSRFYPDTISHFNTPEGVGDLRVFRTMWREAEGKMYLFMDEKVTAKFVKMFMGIRRHLMREAWFFVPKEEFIIVKVDKAGDSYEARPLPLSVAGPNPGHPYDSEMGNAVHGTMRYAFRDFRFDWLADNEDGMAFGLKYKREEFANLGNRLCLVCGVPKPAQHA